MLAQFGWASFFKGKKIVIHFTININAKKTAF